MEAKLEDLFRRRLRQRQQDLVAEMRDGLRMLDEELAGTGMFDSGVRVRGAADTVIQYIESIADAAWSEITGILEANPPRYTSRLAGEIASLIEWALPDGMGLKVLQDHVVNMNQPPLGRSEERIRATRERALRRGKTDAELYVLRLRAEQSVRWYLRPGVIPALITSVAVILTGFLPRLFDLPWRLEWSSELPEEVPEVWVSPSIPDSVAVQLGVSGSAITYDELAGVLADESTTSLHKSTFEDSMDGRTVAWAGVLVSASRAEGIFGGHYVAARIYPVSESIAAARPELVTVHFRDDQRHALAAVPLQAGVLFSGELSFSKHLDFPWLVEAELIGHWIDSGRLGATSSGLPN